MKTLQDLGIEIRAVNRANGWKPVQASTEYRAVSDRLSNAEVEAALACLERYRSML